MLAVRSCRSLRVFRGSMIAQMLSVVVVAPVADYVDEGDGYGDDSNDNVDSDDDGGDNAAADNDDDIDADDVGDDDADDDADDD
eukprot:461707-Pyramimonas_sp.AAC.1